MAAADLPAMISDVVNVVVVFSRGFSQFGVLLFRPPFATPSSRRVIEVRAGSTKTPRLEAFGLVSSF
jgi:hypothetical protein